MELREFRDEREDMVDLLCSPSLWLSMEVSDRAESDVTISVAAFQ